MGAAQRRRPIPDWVLAPATVVILVIGIVSFALAGTGTEETVVAVARLEPLAAAAPTTAKLLEVHGCFQLDLPLASADIPATRGFYEVWLMDPDVQRLISMGPMRADGAYAVPGDIDYHDFPVVDVSVEAADGNPTHSGDSILRGTLSQL